MALLSVNICVCDTRTWRVYASACISRPTNQISYLIYRYMIYDVDYHLSHQIEKATSSNEFPNTLVCPH
jgi:hypothetical protein